MVQFMKLVTKIAAAALLAAAASPAAATTFAGSYDVALNSADPGLVLATAPVTTALNFDLTAAGDTAQVDLFDLFTNETSVNADDKASKPITVDFTFTLPDNGSAEVDGKTKGQLVLGGLFQDGVVRWTGPSEVDFSDGAKLGVNLNNATFNTGFFGLNPGEKAGADITATFTLLQAPTAVPEPATWAVMLAGFGGIGAAMRQRRRTAAAAA
jgi:hypothetical protein